MTRPTYTKINAACERFGAKAVYDAAHRHMAGDKSALGNVGLPDAKSIGDADYIGRVVFRLLDPVEQGLDLAEVTIKLLQGTSGCSDL